MLRSVNELISRHLSWRDSGKTRRTPVMIIRRVESLTRDILNTKQGYQLLNHDVLCSRRKVVLADML
jgi:hypothetical protein